MDTLGKLLDILFRKIPQERVLNKLRQYKEHLHYPHNSQDVFLRYADTVLRGYSEDEQKQMFLYLKHCTDKRSEEIRSHPSVFLPLVEFGHQVLTIQGDTPVCRFEDVLRWREVYHLLGQDLIVCAYLAYCDISSPIRRVKFAWPAVIRTNNSTLEQMLQKGLAENHCHLNGSTQSFALSWYKLMNFPMESSDWLDGFPSLLQSVTGRGPEDNILPIGERVSFAALARALLFKSLHKQDFFNKESTSKTISAYCCEDDFDGFFTKRFSRLVDISNTVKLLRCCYGMPISMPDGEVMRIDYALERHIFLPVANSAYRVLAGERYFLYSCFSASFSGSFTDFENDLFYFYLLTKTAFRGEMIQVNKQIGFENFSNYEKRKDLIWERDPYWWEAYRMAINAPLNVDSVKSLEARFSPKMTTTALKEKVYKYDFAKWFADTPYTSSLKLYEAEFNKEVSDGSLSDEPHFYVLHFPKRRDSSFVDTPEFILQCRHETLRADVKKMAMATADALTTFNYLRERIRGIDACANEVECRPEVFATAFRYLRSLQTFYQLDHSVLLGQSENRISVSYHAGEDFYDITDGLRAIDEAVNFLEFQRGERLGHALALGVDPLVHYSTKSECIIIPKQNYLDNLVWLLYRGRELNIQIEPHQSEVMKQEALHYLREIYGDAIRKNQWSVNLQDYYNSMMLRGDAPQLYRSMHFEIPKYPSCNYDRFQISHAKAELDNLRNDRELAGLYYYYHYGHSEKIKGSEPITVSVTSGYKRVVRQAQDALHRYLEQKGIVIECNPSSNVLIGTFGSYFNHPIFRLNNYGLSNTNSNDSAPPMQVCINTDDLGVFDTSLPFEYALVYRALAEKTNDDGTPKYTSAEIMCYLDNIRKMGLQVVFPKPAK